MQPFVGIMLPKLGPRLLAAASFVRRDVCLYDVGSDHAKFPIYLVKNGAIRKAVASDIAIGPITRAKENIESYEVGDKISTVVCDGVSSLNIISGDDVSILGMGGELISEIISAAPALKNKDVNLILQPMTKVKELSEYLLSNGFSIANETLVYDNGKIYRVILASYSGEKNSLTQAEHLVGKINISRKDDMCIEYVKKQIEILNGIIFGKKSAGIDHSEELNLLNELEDIISDC